jgi:hypothetical protein
LGHNPPILEILGGPEAANLASAASTRVHGGCVVATRDTVPDGLARDDAVQKRILGLTAAIAGDLGGRLAGHVGPTVVGTGHRKLLRLRIEGGVHEGVGRRGVPGAGVVRHRLNGRVDRQVGSLGVDTATAGLSQWDAFAGFMGKLPGFGYINSTYGKVGQQFSQGFGATFLGSTGGALFDEDNADKPAFGAITDTLYGAAFDGLSGGFGNAGAEWLAGAYPARTRPRRRRSCAR